MKYTNPVVKGFYPDPSVCEANGKFYLVCSSFQYFPGVPLFESEDLVNWRQIGHVLTRPTQVMLDNVRSSGGVFAPTIRYNDGRFYMVTNNNSTGENFYVYTDDIYGEWSDPIKVDQGGIDPSLFFENGKCYFISNGDYVDGINGINQCEIDIATGKKLSESKRIWSGSGGRFIESPHMYRIGKYYYLMAAEGGTEYGHMITYARSKSVWGPFVSDNNNPILTNRNKAPHIIQGIGHGDLVCDNNGNWHILCLGFRQIALWQAYHTLGREVFLIPARFDESGRLSAGKDGTADFEYEIDGDFTQEQRKLYTFENTGIGLDWCFMRKPNMDNYKFDLENGIAELNGSEVTLDRAASPTFIALRQRDFDFELKVNVSSKGEAGVTLYACESEHYDLFIKDCRAALKLNIGGIKQVTNSIPVCDEETELIVRTNSTRYDFYVRTDSKEIFLGGAAAKYLSTEVAEGFTGVMIGLYAVGGKSKFRDFSLEYK